MSTSHSQTAIGTGLNGLVGSKLVSLLSNEITFTNIDINDPIQPIDITQPTQIDTVIGSFEGDIVLHCAAYTDVTGAWKQSNDTNGAAYRVNVLGTQNIAQACKQHGKYLIHFSTAYIFDGTADAPYTELDVANPIEWYGKTKWLAEQSIMKTFDDWAILRIDQPFRSDQFSKLDIVHRIIASAKTKTLPPQFVDHTFGPTYIDDLASIVGWFASTKTKGIFHATNGESWNDYDFSQLVLAEANIPYSLTKGSLEKYLQTSNRPYQANTALNTEKLRSVLPFSQTSIADAIRQTVKNLD